MFRKAVEKEKYENNINKIDFPFNLDYDDNNLKLRQVLSFLQERIEYIETLTKKGKLLYKKNFIEIVEQNINLFYLFFYKNQQGYKPPINILQVLDLELEEFSDKEEDFGILKK